MTATRVNNQATIEELEMIRDFIMLPYMLDMCQKSMDDLRYSSNLFKEQFTRVVQLIMNAITRDLAQIRREFNKRQIKVWEDGSIDGIIYNNYTCRGYESRFGIVRETLRSEISVRLAKYASGVFSKPVH